MPRKTASNVDEVVIPEKQTKSKAEILAGVAKKINLAATKRGASGPVAFVAALNEERLNLGRIETGNLPFDNATGGGFPRGGFSMVHGPEGCGKSMLCYNAIAHQQRLNPNFQPMIVYTESSAFPWDSVLSAGVDPNRLWVLESQITGEETLDVLVQFLYNFDERQSLEAVDMVLIDSIAAFMPAAELKQIREKGLAGDTVGRQAAMFSKALRMFGGGNMLGRTAVVMINQQRVNIGSYGGGTVLPGGKAPGYYTKLSTLLKAPSDGYKWTKPNRQGVCLGHKVEGKVTKNNTGRGFPFSSFEYDIIYGKGVDMVPQIAGIAIERGVITQTSSAWFEVMYRGELVKINGRSRISEMLEEDPAFLEFIKAGIALAANAQTVAAAPVTEVTLSTAEESEFAEEGAEGGTEEPEGYYNELDQQIDKERELDPIEEE